MNNDVKLTNVELTVPFDKVRVGDFFWIYDNTNGTPQLKTDSNDALSLVTGQLFLVNPSTPCLVVPKGTLITIKVG